MKALLLWPRMPDSFWSYRNTLQLAGLRSTNPPLELLTVAALLPGDWQIRLVDRNVRAEREEDWVWCDLVLLSAMIVQKEDLRALIEKGVALGKKVAIGGPFATSVPEFALQAGAHYLILDEGECTIPAFLAALARGEEGGIFRATEKPDVTATPAPRFDLLDLNAYICREACAPPGATSGDTCSLSPARGPNWWFEYLIALSAGEHFFAYRHTVRGQLREALGYPQPSARQPAGARPEP